MRGLRELQREALAEEQEAVEEAARQLHVVVDHEQPVGARLLGGLAARLPSSRLRFSNLPTLARARHVRSSSSWRERAARPAPARTARGAARAHDAEREHPCSRGGARRAPRARRRRRPLASCQASTALVARLRSAPSRPPTVPLVPGEEVVASSPFAREPAARTGAGGCARRSRSASRRRPALCATIVRPAGQRRRTT